MQGAHLVTYRASDGTHPIRYLIKREYKAGGMVAWRLDQDVAYLSELLAIFKKRERACETLDHQRIE